MPFQTKTKGRGRGKSDARMSVVKWARENGALHIKVDGIEVVFASAYSPSVQMQPLSPEDIVRRAQPDPEINLNASDALRSQHPDEFADQSDRWANFMPLTARG